MEEDIVEGYDFGGRARRFAVEGGTIASFLARVGGAEGEKILSVCLFICMIDYYT
jgi:hypothetical protein